VASEALAIRFNREEMLASGPGEVVRLALPAGVPTTSCSSARRIHGGGIFSWVGYLRERGKNNRVIVTSGPNGAYGVIDAPEGEFRIVPATATTGSWT
jgi:hypothetical protein